MDELSLLLDGIANKVKKLMLSNKAMKNKIIDLEHKSLQLSEAIASQNKQIKQMEDNIAQIQASKVLDQQDSIHAKQKINELLREIEKSYELIRSQAQ